MMTTIHQMGEKYISITKGAFDVLSERFTLGDVEQATAVNDRFGKNALRVIAVGYRTYNEGRKKSFLKRWKMIFA